jgi:phosphate-selective porin OprO/OprP
LTWALGWFADGADADIGDVTQSNFRIIGRVTGLPFHFKDLHNNRLMHLGMSYSYVNSSGNAVQYGSRPESRVAPTVLDTGEIPANHANLFDAEIAFVVNSLCFQGEYLHSIVNPEEGDTLHFNGYYAYVSYFPTGETRPYDTTRGVFTRVRPKKHFSFKNRTYGGLEIEARYSHLDLNDGDINGGKMNIVTAGVTWYLFPIFKLRVNYGNAYIDNQEAAGHVNIFQARVEVDL